MYNTIYKNKNLPENITLTLTEISFLIQIEVQARQHLIVIFLVRSQFYSLSIWILTRDADERLL